MSHVILSLSLSFSVKNVRYVIFEMRLEIRAPAGTATSSSSVSFAVVRVCVQQGQGFRFV